MDIADGNLTVSYTYKNLKPNVAYEMYFLADDIPDYENSDDKTVLIAADAARTGTGTVSFTLPDNAYLFECTLRETVSKSIAAVLYMNLRTHGNTHVASGSDIYKNVMRITDVPTKIITKGEEPDLEFYGWDSWLGELDVSTIPTAYKVITATTNFGQFYAAAWVKNKAITDLPITSGNERVWFGKPIFENGNTLPDGNFQTNEFLSALGPSMSDVRWQVKQGAVSITSPTPNQQILKGGTRVDLTSSDTGVTWFNVTDPNNVTALTGNALINLQDLPLGTYTYQARKTGSASKDVTFTVFTPVITITSPTDLAIIGKGVTRVDAVATVGGNGTITWHDVTDENNVKNAVPTNLQALPLGTYVYEARSIGADSVQVTFTVADKTGPVITITSPTPNQKIDRASDTAVPFTATVEDLLEGTITNLIVYQDITDPENPRTLTLDEQQDLRLLRVGTHVLQITAADGAGNRSTASVTVTIFDTEPTISISSPVSSETYSAGHDITLTATAFDHDSDGTRRDISSDIVWTNAQGTVLTSPVQLEETQTLTATVTDADEHTASRSVVVTVVDNRPTVQFLNKVMPTNLVYTNNFFGPAIKFTAVSKQESNRLWIDYYVYKSGAARGTRNRISSGSAGNPSRTSPTYFDLEYNASDNKGIFTVPITALQGLDAGAHVLEIEIQDTTTISRIIKIPFTVIERARASNIYLNRPVPDLPATQTEAIFFIDSDFLEADLPENITLSSLQFQFELLDEQGNMYPDSVMYNYGFSISIPDNIIGLRFSDIGRVLRFPNLPTNRRYELKLSIGYTPETGSQFRTVAGHTGNFMNLRNKLVTVEHEFNIGTPAADTTNPVVSITSPTANQQITKGKLPAVNLTATGTDTRDGTVAVTWFDVTDANNVKALTGAALNNIQNLALGTYTYEARATDSSNNLGTARVTFSVIAADTTNPVITVTSPMNMQEIHTSGPKVDVVFTATDNKDGDVSGNVTVQDLSDPENPKAAVLTDLQNLKIGNYTYEFRVSDAAGNMGMEHVMFIVTDVDNTKPVLTITNPPNNGEVQRNRNFNLEATAIDAIDGDISSDITWEDITDPKNPIEITKTTKIKLRGLGNYRYRATVTDSAGNTSRQDVRFEVTKGGDNTSPNLTILGITPNQRFPFGEPIVLMARSIDNRDGDISSAVTWQDITDPKNPKDVTSPYTPSTLGTVTLMAISEDVVENRSTATVSIIIEDRVGPVLQIVQPDPVSFFPPGARIVFRATSLDAKDGDISDGIEWATTGGVIDGNTVTYTQQGTYRLLAQSVDSSGNIEAAFVTIHIRNFFETEKARIEFIRWISDIGSTTDKVIQDTQKRMETLALSLLGTKPALNNYIELGAYYTVIDILAAISLEAAFTDSNLERNLRNTELTKRYESIIRLFLGSDRVLNKTTVKEFGGVENKRGHLIDNIPN